MENQYSERFPSVIESLGSTFPTGGKWTGSYTNASELAPPVLHDAVLTERQRILAKLGGPAKGWIDNRSYGSAPYPGGLDYSEINKNRLGKDTLLPVPGLTKIEPGMSPGAGALTGRHGWVGTLVDSPAYAENGEESSFNLPLEYSLINGYEPGLYRPSSMQTLAHELNHVNNMPSPGYVKRVQERTKTLPGFSVNTYPGFPGISETNRTAEALQSLASRKRSEAAETGKVINTPEEMAESLQRLHDRKDERRPVGEEHRLGNYLRTSARDYDNAEQDVSRIIRNTGGPVMGEAMDKILKSPREGFNHPAINNISETYREAIPDLVKNEQDSEEVRESKAARALGIRLPSTAR